MTFAVPGIVSVPRIRLFRTSSFRLAVLYAGLLTVSVLVLFGVTYLFATDYATQDEDNEIGVEFASIQDEPQLSGQSRLAAIIDNHLRLRKDVRAVYLLQDSAGQKIIGNVAAMSPVMGPATLRLFFDDRLRPVRAHGYRLANGDYLLIGQDTRPLRDMTALIVRALGVGLVATLMLALLGGVIVSTTMLKRIDAVSRTARAIVGGDMSQRVPVGGTDDESDELAASVNAMLNRIEDLMRSMRQVSNDVAHDLRTPLTRVRQRLEHARRRAQTTEELHEALGHSIAQVDSILETFGALLRIAQIEAGGRASEKSAINVSKLLAAIVDDFAPAAADPGQNLGPEIDKGLSISGDPELLTQMVVNLVDNAIRHSPPGSRICIEAKALGDSLELAVVDNGPGIPQRERENVLRPFYRLESSRPTEGRGSVSNPGR